MRTVSLTVSDNESATHAYQIAPLAIAVLGATYLLLTRNRPAGTGVFIGGGFALTAWTLVVTGSPDSAALLPRAPRLGTAAPATGSNSG